MLKQIKKLCHFDLPAGEEKSLIHVILASSRVSSLMLGMTERQSFKINYLSLKIVFKF